MNVQFFCLGLTLLYGSIFAAFSKPLSIPVLDVKVINGAILVQWNYTGHIIGTILKYRVTYIIFPDPNVTNIVVDTNTNFALIATTDHPGRLYNISVQVETNRGLIQPSKSRFTRAGCGGSVFIPPTATGTVASPHYPDQYEPGVFCKWTIYTNHTYALGYYLKNIDFGHNVSECKHSYLSILGSKTRQYLCYNHTTVETRLSSLNVIFQSRVVTNGRGFQIFFKSVVKKAGTPSNIVMKAVERGIYVYWSKPEGSFLPVTSYSLQFTSLPDGTTHRLKLSPTMHRYIISASGHEGQLYMINISANIGENEGIPATLFFRAPCSRSFNLSNGQSINITSPLYPNVYPRGISCIWRIRSQNGESIQLTILEMDIEDEVFCSSDYLAFSTQTEKLCGKLRYPKVIQSDQKIDINFFSDGDKTGKGFLIQAKALGSKTSPSTSPPETSTILFSTKPVTGTNFYIKDSLKTSSLPSPVTSPFSSINALITNNTQTMYSSTENFITPTESVKTDTVSYSAVSLNNSNVTSGISHLASTSLISTDTESSTKAIKTTSDSLILSTASSNHDSEIQRNTTYFEPNLDNMTYSVHFNLTLRMLDIHKSDHATNLRHQVQKKLTDIFNDSDMFNNLVIDDIELDHKNKTAQIRFTLSYDLKSLLNCYQQNDSFRLIDHINRTCLEHLSRDSAIADDWTFDSDVLRSFRIHNFEIQEVNDPCDTLQSICSGNYTCVRMNTSSVGFACCNLCVAKEFPTCKSSESQFCMNTASVESTTEMNAKHGQRGKGDNSSTVIIVVTLSILSIAMALATLFIYVCRKKKQCSGVPVKDTGRLGCIEMHDILLQAKYIGDKNVEFTAFKLRRKSKSKQNTGGSLPSRNNNKYKIDEDIESKIKQLGLFIEDKETLKKRLGLKTALRRGNSF